MDQLCEFARQYHPYKKAPVKQMTNNIKSMRVVSSEYESQVKIKKLSKKLEWVGNFKSNNCEKNPLKKESLSSAIETT